LNLEAPATVYDAHLAAFHGSVHQLKEIATKLGDGNVHAESVQHVRF
jgi:hypothetical protein